MKTLTKNRFLSMASTVLLLALVGSLALTQSALAAITCQWEPFTGTLTITSDGNDNIIVTCDTEHPPAAVLVNGNWDILGNGQSVEAQDVNTIVVNGGPGNNVIDLTGVGPDCFPNMDGTTISGGAGNDVIYGSDFADFISGNEGNDVISGYLGNDQIFGDSGDDYLEGGEGDDILCGGEGDDTYYQDPGSTDIVDDSEGEDTLDFTDAASAITINLDLQNVDQIVDAAGNTVQLRGQIEHCTGSAFDDTLSLGPLNVPRTITGGDGNDTLNFDAKGLPATDDGSTITVPGYGTVTYAGFEVVHITNSGRYQLCLPLILR